MNILITGGAGYIGSFMARLMVKKSVHRVIILDTFEHGHRAALPDESIVISGSTGDREHLRSVFSQYRIDAVMHFAAYLSVEESVRNPTKYFKNNLIEPLMLLETMEEFATKYLIFSSTAAVYGYPKEVPIPETHPLLPESPYGLSKWCMERMLAIYDRRNLIKSMSLRYFNASGASLDGLHGEDHRPESHLIPLAIKTALGQRDSFTLFGTDYNTRDGTCERDYIHVEDLCSAHEFALDALVNGHETTIYNIGTGGGLTNKEILSEIVHQTGVNFPIIYGPRRSGDPDVLVASSARITKDLGWKPQVSDISTIMRSAILWHTSHPLGYES